MPIPVKKEDRELSDEFCSSIKSCFFCGNKTLYWYIETNVPVCESCAKTHNIEELSEACVHKIFNKIN